MLSANSSVSWTKKHSPLAKWNILFDKSPEWIAFKPRLGAKVYPCYSCKNMFSSKLTFQDHINRRVVIIKYKCVDCTNTFTFYNRCSFLLHVRKHFRVSEGSVNLSHVDISLLPIELSGFERHESVPFLFDEEEESVAENATFNTQFYAPEDCDAGKQLITMKPFNLVFHYAENGSNVLLVLKQISSNLPLCEFITQAVTSIEKAPEPEIKQEVPDEDDFTLPVISKIESLNSRSALKCSECAQTVELSLVAHFLGQNKPLDESLCCGLCKYIAPTKCSLQAHKRIHESLEPYVCPDCGKQFDAFDLLQSHMEEVCFHLNKHVRFRCPALKCGKLFVMRNTYSSHFINHFQSLYQCNFCKTNFMSDTDFNAHSTTHDPPSAYLKIFNCSVCSNVPNLTEDKFPEHINWHLQFREGYVYIFNCKFCRSYFRSNATYFVHKQRCSKGDRNATPQLTMTCQFCPAKILYREKDAFKTCPACKKVNTLVLIDGGNKPQCMLCKETLTKENKESHDRRCRYNNPIVTIQALNEENEDSCSSEKFTDGEAHSHPDTSSDSNENRRKRKRTLGGVSRSKRVSSEDFDLQLDKPPSFDGTYSCQFCSYKDSNRGEFQKHIITHRDISTAYQCMECGECFVVKPSLIKHLTFFHKISNIGEYLSSNNCYNKEAIEELESNLKLVPGEHKGPVNENQCTVCLEQFEDSLSLSKHFRIHGLAFLMTKTK